ncbi:MAG: ADP-ribosylation factor-like protein, partial [Promethearchaeota archaeon]
FVFGLDRAGKTTLIKYFTEKKYIPQTPTLGVSITNIIFSKLELLFTDVGGQPAFRPEWEKWLKKPHVLVFVADATDRNPDRIQESLKELNRILMNRQVTGVPLIFLSNKVDLPLAMSKQTMMKKFKILETRDRTIAFYEVSAKTGLNMMAVLNAIASIVLKDSAIEYFVSSEMRRQARALLANYKDFLKRGENALNSGRPSEALANLNIAKEISSNLFELGVISDKKTIQKLNRMLSRAKNDLDKELARSEEDTGMSHLTTLRMQAKRWFSKKKQDDDKKVFKIFLFGLNKAGKTTFVDYLKKEKYLNHQPTLGIDVAKIALGKINFWFNDLGGQKALRSRWMDYWEDQDLMVFIIDASDVNRFAEAKLALWSVISQPQTKDKPLLIISNKHDMPEARNSTAIKDALDFDKIKQKLVGFYEISIKNNYNLDKPLNFMVSIALKDEDVEKYVSKELKRLLKNYKEMYNAFIKEAKILEKEKNYKDAYNRIFKARLIQEELFKNGISKAQKEIKNCDKMLARLSIF